MTSFMNSRRESQQFCKSRSSRLAPFPIKTWYVSFFSKVSKKGDFYEIKCQWDCNATLHIRNGKLCLHQHVMSVWQSSRHLTANKGKRERERGRKPIICRLRQNDQEKKNQFSMWMIWCTLLGIKEVATRPTLEVPTAQREMPRDDRVMLPSILKSLFFKKNLR